MEGHPGPPLADLRPCDPATSPLVILFILFSNTASRVEEKAVSEEVAGRTEVVGEAGALGVPVAEGLADGHGGHMG